MSYVWLASPVFLGVNGREAEFVHEASDTVSASEESMRSREFDDHSPRTVEGAGRVDFIQCIHDPDVLFADVRLVIQAASRSADEFGLATDGQRRMFRFDERPPIQKAQIV